jgi:hypothetical protein
MSDDETGKILHDMATQGKPLSREEHNLLKQWYKKQENAVSNMLRLNANVEPEDILQKQIDAILVSSLNFMVSQSFFKQMPFIFSD